MTDIDFDKIKRDYSMPDIASKGGVELIRDGREWRASCPFHGENTPSFCIYEGQRGWTFHCFGCGAHGDNVDLAKHLYGVRERDAVEIITGQKIGNEPVRRDFTYAADPYAGYVITRPPADAPPIVAGKRTPPLLNPKRVEDGHPKYVTYIPREVYAYRSRDGDLLGYVLRVEFDGRKITPGIWWTKNTETGFAGWSHGSLPSPRPLYNLHELYRRPQAQVLLVEGEKCADRAARVLGDKVAAVTWPGGGKSISKVEWRHLKGRSVLIWPDNDEEGWRSVMGYADNGRWTPGIVERLFDAEVGHVKIVHITASERPKGWDIADAVDKDGLNAAAISMIIKDRVQVWSRERFMRWKDQKLGKDENPVGEPDAGREEDADQDERDGSARLEGAQQRAPANSDGGSRPARGFEINDETWRAHLIMTKDGDGLKGNSLQNYALLLQYEPRFRNIFALNEFARKVYLMRRPPWDMSGNLKTWTPRGATDSDSVAAACWLEYCGMSPKVSDVEKVILRVAMHNKFNPVTDRLEEIQWDGVKRLDVDEATPGWLTYYLGADDTLINTVFGMKWLVGAVARAYEPGCKMDTMMILEGAQGLRKSTALRTLADAIAPGLFTDEMSDPSSKDAGMQMQGAWIVEIAELDAFRAAEVTTLKAWLARQVDRFRPPFGRLVAEFPRSCVFAGTVNPSGSGYLKDSTGNRRFWPVKCAAIDISGLKRDAAQLWAEATHLYRDGVKWWLSEEEEALARHIQEQRYEEDPWSDLIQKNVTGRTRVKIHEIMHDMEMKPKDMNAFAQHRIAKHLQKNGWIRMRELDQTVYRKPEEELI